MNKCKDCGKEFTTKKNLIYHRNNMVCNDRIYKCKYCDNKYSARNSVYRHMKNDCLVKKERDEYMRKQNKEDESNQYVDELNEFVEESNEFVDELNEFVEEPNEIIEESNETVDETKQIVQQIKPIIDEIKKTRTNSKDNVKMYIAKVERQMQALVEKIQHLETELTTVKQSKQNIITNNGEINNGEINNINNGTINNITLIAYGKEDLTLIEKKYIIEGFKSGFKSTVCLTDNVHFNPDHPEYHNIYIPSLKDSHALKYDGKDWKAISAKELIDEIYESKKSYIEENIDEFCAALTKSQRESLKRWLCTNDDDKKIRKIKSDIRMTLYNNKDMAIKQRTIMKEDDKKSTRKQKLINENQFIGENDNQLIRENDKPVEQLIKKQEPLKKSGKVVLRKKES